MRGSRNGNRPATIRGFQRSRFSLNVADTTAQLLAGINANTAVTSYVNALIATTLPTIQNPPSWWPAVTSNFAGAQTNAMQWVNVLASEFSSIPAGIAAYNSLFQQAVAMIEEYCEALENGPNSGDQSSLQATLNGLVTQMSATSTQASDFATGIDNFAGLLSGDSTNLNTALQQSLQLQGADQSEITALQNQIDQLYELIAQNNQIITNAITTTTVTVYIAVLGITLTYQTVTYNLGTGVFGMAESIATAAAAQAAIQQAQSNITSAINAMTPLNQQIATLSAVNNQLSNLVFLVAAAQQSIEAITQAWDGLTDDLTAVSNDLASVQDEEQSSGWSALLDDMQTAQSDWNALQTTAGSIALVTYNVSNSIITIP